VFGFGRLQQCDEPRLEIQASLRILANREDLLELVHHQHDALIGCRRRLFQRAIEVLNRLGAGHHAHVAPASGAGDGVVLLQRAQQPRPHYRRLAAPRWTDDHHQPRAALHLRDHLADERPPAEEELGALLVKGGQPAIRARLVLQIGREVDVELRQAGARRWAILAVEGVVPVVEDALRGPALVSDVQNRPCSLGPLNESRDLIPEAVCALPGVQYIEQPVVLLLQRQK
jgi:hypothetical protein